MTKKKGIHGGPDHIVDYESNTGEHIRVVSGVYYEEKNRKDSVRVWEDREKIEEYSRYEVPKSWIPHLRSKLEGLAEAGANVDEIVMAIETLGSQLSEFEERRIDNPDELDAIPHPYFDKMKKNTQIHSDDNEIERRYTHKF